MSASVACCKKKINNNDDDNNINDNDDSSSSCSNNNKILFRELSLLTQSTSSEIINLQRAFSFYSKIDNNKSFWSVKL